MFTLPQSHDPVLKREGKSIVDHQIRSASAIEDTVHNIIKGKYDIDADQDEYLMVDGRIV